MSTLENEHDRIAALHALNLLDTRQQDCFDRVTSQCTEITGCSIAIISLIDTDRQWFLSAIGLAVLETPRNISFCSHAIETGCELLVSDAAKDERFKDNPLVTDDPAIRSYFGQPIHSPDGYLLGTLCVADQRPNRVSAVHIKQLKRLALVVEDLIHLHNAKLLGDRLLADVAAKADSLSRANRIFKQAEKIAQIGSWEFNVETAEIIWSDEVYIMHEQPIGSQIDLESALNCFAPEDRDLLILKIRQAIETGQSYDIEINLVADSSRLKRVRTMGEFIPGQDDQPPRVVGVLQDITDTYRARAELQRAATLDSLTNLLNRHAFDNALNEHIGIRRKVGQSLTLLLFDLDGFKDVNDACGHLVGDAVLEEISERISRSKPADCVLARWGGDEFALILPIGASVEDACRWADKILENILQQSEIGGQGISISATCGIAQMNGEMTGKELVRRADAALYFGKRVEPGRVHLYSETLEAVNTVRQKAINEVRSAMAGDRLFAGYQPIVELSTRKIIGYEALMRLHTRAGRKLTATQVLPAILDPQVSRDIGEKMLDFVCADMPTLKAAQPDIQFVSINSTGGDLLSRSFAENFLRELDQHDVTPSSLVVEVTETMLLVNDTKQVKRVLEELKEAGVKIALDDFGTGFSSLSHLREFPIDKVKIDRSFVQSMAEEHQARLIVQALIGMANGMGISVIAEGVETKNQWDCLLQMGCKYGQGYLFSPAQDIARIALLRLASPRPTTAKSSTA